MVRSFRSYHTLFFGKTQAAPLTTAEESIIIKLMTLVLWGRHLDGQRTERESITVAAAELIEQYGRSGFSMRLLADTMGVKIASLYNHIENMDTLLTEDRPLCPADAGGR